MFLLYHYFHGIELYNPIRVMIAAYVWMTGFGNFLWFYPHGSNDNRESCSIVRVLQMLWRLNFASICLCMTLNVPYLLYYICALHSYFFLLVYLTMRIGHSFQWSNNAKAVRIKLIVLGVFIYVVWDLDNGFLFTTFHGMFLNNQPTIGASSGPLWEWYFRSTLDHWATLWGMVFALHYPVTCLWIQKMEQRLDWGRCVVTKAIVGVSLLTATAWWIHGPFQQERFEYNQSHAYFSIIPLLTYIYFRNLTPWLRSHSLGLLQSMGQTTLETYLLQHHIWMTTHSQTLLTIIPGYPQMNFLVATAVYVVLSRCLFRVTLTLRSILLPSSSTVWECLRNLGSLTGAFAVCYTTVLFIKDAK